MRDARALVLRFVFGEAVSVLGGAATFTESTLFFIDKFNGSSEISECCKFLLLSMENYRYAGYARPDDYIIMHTGVFRKVRIKSSAQLRAHLYAYFFPIMEYSCFTVFSKLFLFL